MKLDHSGAARADQMMVMAVIAFLQQLKPRDAVAEFEALDHAHAFQQVHRAIHRRQIAIAFGQGGKDFFVRQGMGALPQDLEDGLTRAGDFARLAA